MNDGWSAWHFSPLTSKTAILEGRQPAHIRLEQLIERPIPIGWEEQRRIFQP